MTTPLSTQSKPIKIHFNENETQVVVTPEDQDIYLVTVKEIIEASRMALAQKELMESFRFELLRPLKRWCEANRDQISACYISRPKSGSIPVYVIGSTERYDSDLVPKMIEIEDQLLQNAGWNAHCHQIPLDDMDTLATFFDPETSLEVYHA